jgi:C4-dicarboxylate-specific signal transduction histidine kinase
MSERPKETRLSPDAADADLLAPSLLHELRQPLTGADAAAVLIERARPELKRSDDWRLLRAQLARLGEIVAEYDSLFRPGAATPEPFAVGPVVTRAVDLLAHRVKPLARRFGLEHQDGGRQGWGAPGALVHAATNLLANALEAVEKRGAGTRVLVRVLHAAAGGVEVRVSDEGAGIAPEHRARVFEPGFTTKGDERGGGLGLHVARQLMNRYGGEVFLVPDDDPARAPWAGTEFCIAVPPPPAGGAA